ncbi:phosphate regulon sensor histidine kinase PhoR [Limnohabitans sp. T6-5]|uniref:phosphate regulon sensor histidine kinase PhoR n=1 Tax=Limnohabitans sp. T6-5 TaxID=1100724 RepID=UPI000D3D1E83|nr:phosphate regulon sensor histidine kinase PhoR [Limnohabitans sp. T6-5]PUE09225.1 phosphate regulon sensor histidine kinase PhoR [Limnohabitans sp. T6-5]
MLIPIFELLFWALLVAVPAWFFGGGQVAVLATFVLVVLVHVNFLWKVQRLEHWLSSADLHADVHWKGIWSEIGRRIQRLLIQREKKAATAQQRLQHFLAAIQASPNGVTLLDKQGRIEWCNETASSHLGLDVRRDMLQHVVHLVRDPVFSRYFAQKTHDTEVIIDGPSNSLTQNVKLSVQLHAFGEGQQLLLTRDITSVALADAMRRDFVANVSHEIRTPLTVLSGFVETLQSIPLEEQERQSYLNLMSLQADRMQSLVADLLTLSQLEGSLPPGKHEKTAVPELMTQVFADARALSAVLSGQEGEDRGPVHELVFEPSPPWVLLGVRSELMSAMSNLVSNAVRYTPAGGLIRAKWSRSNDWVTFSVTDTGPGIAPEHLPRLSERFYRVDRSRSRETGGTGLGLAIAKHVAQRHGGELRIESQVGVGSTFMLVFPVSRLEIV